MRGNQFARTALTWGVANWWSFTIATSRTTMNCRGFVSNRIRICFINDPSRCRIERTLTT
jgi:hypothetical protein